MKSSLLLFAVAIWSVISHAFAAGPDAMNADLNIATQYAGSVYNTEYVIKLDIVKEFPIIVADSTVCFHANDFINSVDSINGQLLLSRSKVVESSMDSYGLLENLDLRKSDRGYCARVIKTLGLHSVFALYIRIPASFNYPRNAVTYNFDIYNPDGSSSTNYAVSGQFPKSDFLYVTLDGGVQRIKYMSNAIDQSGKVFLKFNDRTGEGLLLLEQLEGETAKMCTVVGNIVKKAVYCDISQYCQNSDQLMVCNFDAALTVYQPLAVRHQITNFAQITNDANNALPAERISSVQYNDIRAGHTMVSLQDQYNVEEGRTNLFAFVFGAQKFLRGDAVTIRLNGNDQNYFNTMDLKSLNPDLSCAYVIMVDVNIECTYHGNNPYFSLDRIDFTFRSVNNAVRGYLTVIHTAVSSEDYPYEVYRRYHYSGVASYFNSLPDNTMVTNHAYIAAASNTPYASEKEVAVHFNFTSSTTYNNTNYIRLRYNFTDFSLAESVSITYNPGKSVDCVFAANLFLKPSEAHINEIFCPILAHADDSDDAYHGTINGLVFHSDLVTPAKYIFNTLMSIIQVPSEARSDNILPSNTVFMRSVEDIVYVEYAPVKPAPLTFISTNSSFASYDTMTLALENIELNNDAFVLNFTQPIFLTVASIKASIRGLAHQVSCLYSTTSAIVCHVSGSRVQVASFFLDIITTHLPYDENKLTVGVGRFVLTNDFAHLPVKYYTGPVQYQKTNAKTTPVAMSPVVRNLASLIKKTETLAADQHADFHISFLDA